MERDAFFKHFELFADTPDSVAKMRETLLELALQGKLVPQDARDEPATELLERIAKLRAKSGKATGEISRPVSADEMPYRLPANWVWTRLSVAGDTNPRNNLEDDTEVSFVPMKFISATYGAPVQSEEREWGEVRRGFTHFADNDVVVAKITPCFENGKSAVVRELVSGYGAGTTELHVFRPLDKTMVPEYVLIYLKSPSFLRGGVEHMTGTAGQQRVAYEFFAENPFPLPPLAEQKRIVAKVGELMGLCDELAARQQAQCEARARLTQSAFTHLTASKDEKAFRHHTGFLLQNSAIAFDDVAQLRQTVLQLATTGWLATNVGEEHAVERSLLAHIEPPKNQARGRTGASLGPVTRDEMDFALPSNWVWARLYQLCEHDAPIVYGILQPGPNIKPDGVPYIRPSEIENEKIDLHSIRHTTRAIAEQYSRSSIAQGDIILTIVGTLGATAVVPPELDGGNITQSSCRIRPNPKLINRGYLVFCLQSPLLFSQYSRFSLGSAVSRLNIAHVRALAIPVPPLAEQKRIVAKVAELLRLCDELEAWLAQSRTLGEQLLDATIRQLLVA